MIPKKHRLSKSADVKSTTARGRSFFNPYFVIKCLKSESSPQVTVIVSTKVSKKAVVRNRIKRVVRETVRKRLLEMKPGRYAFIVKNKATAITSPELSDQVSKALVVAKIVK